MLPSVFPQQRKPMGSSAQNSSGSTRFQRKFRRFRRRFQETLVQSQGSGESLGGFGAEPSQVQQGSGEGSGEGLGGFGAKPGAKPGQAQHGSEEGSGRLWCRARVLLSRVPKKVAEKVREALVQSQVRFNRVQSQVRFNRVPEKVLEKV